MPAARKLWTGADGRVALFAGATRDARGTATFEIAGRRVSIAAPPMRGGISVAAVTLWPDGRSDVSVSIFALPVGRSWDPVLPDIPPVGKIARALAYAAPLFRTGVNLEEVPDAVMMLVAYAKWVDPVLGALAFHAYDLRLAGKAARGPRFESLRNMRETIRANMARHFGDLPDSRIIGALDSDPDLRRSGLLRLLDDDKLGQPVLTASLAHLVQAAIGDGRDDHWTVKRFDGIPPGQVFNSIESP
jgi:hypothetical protein